jgi:2-oxoglutarate dehydrogenase E1 component
MATGNFQEVIDDPNAVDGKVDTLVLCSGKFYYEATEKAKELGVENMAFVRVEQLYPLPLKQLEAIKQKYGTDKVIWAQEEPANMGAWNYMAMELRDWNLIGVSRRSSAAAAEGSHDLHKRRLKRLFDELFEYGKATVKA